MVIIYDSLLQVWVATTYGFVSALGQGIALIPTMTIGEADIDILEAFYMNISIPRYALVS